MHLHISDTKGKQKQEKNPLSLGPNGLMLFTQMFANYIQCELSNTVHKKTKLQLRSVSC